ncbi:glycosyltransferase family 2 protein [Parasphingorhabdus cellanae]|uniref:Glycosyltransferase n=1 Tax=Parasphingorhabdus cellanae TaxID=2806553 RepID=A0ABX7T547_9SPHN|nr:glycosyltransferase [Parasphingorhabdus cellanae]QTD56709.1 glycosyltransferase [Parasphingorhabdus cellanae]
MKIQPVSSFSVSDPSITIVMPVYNGARYLDSAIRSVLQQRYSDWELICIDDGSTDGSDAIIMGHAMADQRIRHLSNGQNLGLPATLNRGFTEARGMFHSWTSDDNILRADMLVKLVEELENRPDVDMVYAGYSVIDDADNIMRYVAPPSMDKRWYGNPVGAAFLYRREVTEKLGGYDEQLFGAEDYDYWMRAAHYFEMMPLDVDLYLYRRHDRSLTDQRSKDIRQLVSKVLLRELEQVDDKALRANALVHRILSSWYHFDVKLFGKALASHPPTVLKASPRLAIDLARAIWHRVRP